MKQDSWIMDGNYQNTFDIRFPASDTIIVLDINRFVCFWRIWKRRMLQNRSDKLENCNERINFEFMKWVLWDYPSRGKNQISVFLKEYYNKNIVVIKSTRQMEEFIKK